MTETRLLLAVLSNLVAFDPAIAGVFRCDLQQYSTSIYDKDRGGWSNTSGDPNRKRALVVTLNEDGTNRAAIENTERRHTEPGQWSLVAGHITVTAPSEIGGFTLLSIFKDVDGKRPANYSVHTLFGYGATGAYSGFCTAQ